MRQQAEVESPNVSLGSKIRRNLYRMNYYYSYEKADLGLVSTMPLKGSK